MSEESSRLKASVAYWRAAYEELVRQTGRDLNDGLGIDPRKLAPSPLSQDTSEPNDLAREDQSK